MQKRAVYTVANWKDALLDRRYLFMHHRMCKRVADRSFRQYARSTGVMNSKWAEVYLYMQVS